MERNKFRFLSNYVEIGNDGNFYSYAVPCDIDGNPVRRTKADYPYSYDCYIICRKDEKLKKDTHAVYHDRMWEQDSHKFDESWDRSGGKGHRFNNADKDVVEKFLQLFYDDEKITLEAIGE